jgi:hypothetical protein
MQNKMCASCGSAFECGIEAGEMTCWCFDLPHVIPLDSIGSDDKTGVDCLCPTCLQQKIDDLTQ